MSSSLAANAPAGSYISAYIAESLLAGDEWTRALESLLRPDPANSLKASLATFMSTAKNVALSAIGSA